jgi:hypothetical protein
MRAASGYALKPESQGGSSLEVTIHCRCVPGGLDPSRPVGFRPIGGDWGPDESRQFRHGGHVGWCWKRHAGPCQPKHYDSQGAWMASWTLAVL